MLRNRRKLQLETLESRQLLSATVPTTYLPTPEWFATLPRVDDVDRGFPTVARPPVEVVSWRGQTAEMKRGEWIVQFDPATTARLSGPADAQSLLQADGFSAEVAVGMGLPGMVLIRTNASVSQMENWLGGLPFLDFYEPNTLRQLQQAPDDPLYDRQYALENDGIPKLPDLLPRVEDADMDAEAAWEITTGDASTIVAVVDTGVDYRHEDLNANMWVNPGEIPGNSRDDDGNGFIDDIHGYDFGDDDADPMDFEGHGTAVAGTIGAVGNNGIGVTGINWNVRIMALKVADVAGRFSNLGVIRAVNYITMMANRGTNVHVSNHSYGGGPPSAADERTIIAHREADIVYVVSAGNDGLNNDTIPNFPSNYGIDNMIAVAATGPEDELVGFSNYGQFKVDIGAAGLEVLTTSRRDGYAPISGTSFSSPYTAGVAALVKSHAPTANFQEVRQAILQGVDIVPSLVGRTVTGGRLNAYGALRAIEQIKPAVASVLGNEIAIENGDNTPSTGDGTDLGSINAANGQASQTFTLANVGGVPLKLTAANAFVLSGPQAADFRLTPVVNRDITGGTSVEFTLTFDPGAAGLRTALLTVQFDTAGPYSFAIQGTGLAPPPPWQNPRDKYDVNNDIRVSGLDVLVLINEINRSGQHALPPPGPGASPPPYYDVNGDGSISAADIIQVINQINARSAGSGNIRATATDTVLTAAADRSMDVLFKPELRDSADDLANGLAKRSTRRGRA